MGVSSGVPGANGTQGQACCKREVPQGCGVIVTSVISSGIIGELIFLRGISPLPPTLLFIISTPLVHHERPRFSE